MIQRLLTARGGSYACCSVSALCRPQSRATGLLLVITLLGPPRVVQAHARSQSFVHPLSSSTDMFQIHTLCGVVRTVTASGPQAAIQHSRSAQ